MARTVLIIGAIAWLGAGGTAVVLGAAGTDLLLSLLPPLAIDADALGGALTAMALTLVAIGAAHLLVVAGLGRGRRWALSAGALLASVLAVVSVGLAATAAASSFRDTNYALPLAGAALVAALSATGYAIAAVRLARALGSRSAA